VADKFSTFPMRSLERAIFDARYTADSKPLGAFAWKQCFAVIDGKLARSKGFGKPFLPCCRNSDYHSQPGEREPITLQFPSVANDNSRRLFIGTKTRIAVLDETAGDYTILGSGFGADGNSSLTQVRFHASELQNVVVFTNGFDLVQYHEIASGTLQPIPDLANAGEDHDSNVVPVMAAEVTVSWQGFEFLMNTLEGTERFASRIRWSDLNRPLLWTPGQAAVDGIDPICGFQDLDYGEVILAAIPFGGALYVFTDKSIWKCTITIDATQTDPAEVVTLSCSKIYTEPKNQAKCLAYRNAIVNDGTAFWYAGRDGIYRFKPGYTAEPERVEWLHRSTKIILPTEDGPPPPATQIDKRACQSPVMEFFPATDELHFSWPVAPPAETDVPDCENYVPAAPTPGEGLNWHTLVANTKFETADYRPYGATSYANFRSDTAAQGNCNQAILRLMAASRDFTLKQMDDRNGWEFYNPSNDAYTIEGYYSILRGVFPFEKFDVDKILKSFLVELTPDDPTDTALIACRIGVSYESLDPNAANGRCEVLWKPLTSKPIKCRNNYTADEYNAMGVQPYGPVKWAFLRRGKILYYEVTIIASDGTAPIAGGCSASRFEVTAKLS